MFRRSLGLGLFFLLLAACTQTAQKPFTSPPPEVESQHPRKIIKQVYALPPTHAATQNITYNSHYPPHFPQEAIKAGHYGVVTLMILVSAKGEIGDIRVDRSSGYPELDASAVEAARHWMFGPEEKNGVPQSGWVRMPVAFDRPALPPPPAGGM
jgi:TonB family protein